MAMIGRIICVVLTVLLIPAPVFAGSAAGGAPQFKAEQLVALSKKLEREIAARRARVAIISRVGRPPGDLPDGIEFTHVAFAVYSQITLDDGRRVPGYAMYNLYQSDERPNSSFLRQDYPLDYYTAVQQLKAGIIIPKPRCKKDC